MSRLARKAIADINAALTAYYGTGYISNAQIGKIFGTNSTGTISRLKKPVRLAEKEQGVPVVVNGQVNARIAFEIWGIDVKELERNIKKAKELGLC